MRSTVVFNVKLMSCKVSVHAFYKKTQRIVGRVNDTLVGSRDEAFYGLPTFTAIGLISRKGGNMTKSATHVIADYYFYYHV